MTDTLQRTEIILSNFKAVQVILRYFSSGKQSFDKTVQDAHIIVTSFCSTLSPQDLGKIANDTDGSFLSYKQATIGESFRIPVDQPIVAVRVSVDYENDSVLTANAMASLCSGLGTNVWVAGRTLSVYPHDIETAESRASKVARVASDLDDYRRIVAKNALNMMRNRASANHVLSQG